MSRLSRQGEEVQSWGLAIGIDSDSRILVSGHAGLGPVVWRFLQDGTPDELFGGAGYVALEEQHPGLKRFFGLALILDSSGRIVVAGRTDGLEYDMGVCRLSADGSLDRTFGTDGVVTYDLRRGFGGEE